ncbi:transcriptional regulator [Caulobacter sp. AP07]|uniref:LacI family DNA-binding transcriptional regulator n=1 Tax=Caulobacter sp. AP07 TaxID=1144304 RepID=UPI000271E902|nr:LacI family DNA-binding transcriptional regulator [Caulobacter sp. AP07]EJL26112.1 transcriptional regulator [Caulobacter sp. AP07]
MKSPRKTKAALGADVLGAPPPRSRSAESAAAIGTEGAVNTVSRPITIHDVARHAGVGSMTVSRVIRGTTNVSPAMREKVEASVRALNYQVNVAARATRSRATAARVGILYSNPSASYLSEIMMGGLEESSRLASHLMLERCEGLAGQRQAVERLLAAGVDGVILPPPLCDSRQTIDMLRAEGVTVLALATARPMQDVSSVRIDDYEGALAMTRHLIALGHRDIAFIKGDPEHTPTELRFEGFLAGMAEADLAVRPEWIVQGLFTYRSGLVAAEKLFEARVRPSAIFASNDDMAAATLAVAHGRQIAVPRDLSVCGFDDTAVASTVWPELTTIHQPIADMGRAAVALIVDEIRARKLGGTQRPAHKLMSFTLVDRASSGLAPP